VPDQGVTRKVGFEIRPWGGEPGGARELLPLVDGMSLVDLVAGFEKAAGYDMAGGYAGLVVDHFNFGDLTSYLTGEPGSSYWEEQGAIALLGCDCGEVGCWPLAVRVVVDEEFVTWRGFAQPHRPKRDYDTFGPFVFDRTQYYQAVRRAVREI
jgi:hypothetical protein